MKVLDIKLSDITPYENNPRNNEEAVEPVLNSIKEFGFKVPIVIDKNNIIVAGHTRYKAAKKLKLKIVPCIIADDLNEEQIRAFRLVDNKVSEIATWDYNILNFELENIMNIDMGMFDFDLSLDDIPEELELERDEIGSAKSIKSLKYGNININMTEEEATRFDNYYKNYVEENGNIFGLVLELLINGDKNYEN